MLNDKKLICIVVLLSLCLYMCFAYSECFGAINAGISTSKEVAIKGKVGYMFLTVNGEAVFPLADKFEQVRLDNCFGVGLEGRPDPVSMGLALMFGEKLVGIDLYSSADFEKFVVGSHLWLNTELGSHNEYNYGGARGVYKESYMEVKIELEGSFKITSNILITGTFIADWGGTSCWDEWGGKHWKPGSTEIGNSKKDSWSKVIGTASIGFRF